MSAAERSRSVLLLFILAFASGGAVRAQEAPSRERVAEAARQAQAELAAERERMKKEEAAQESELAQWSARVEEWSGRLVDGRTALEEGQRRAAELRRERDTAAAAIAEARRERAEARRIVQDAARRLAGVLDLLPPSSSRARQRETLTALDAGLTSAGDALPEPGPLCALLDGLHAEAFTSEVFSHEVRCGDGAAVQAEVLRVGHVLHAYRSESPARLGLAMASTRSADEYRWDERPSSGDRARLAEAFSRVRAGDAAVVLPADVTGKLPPGRAQGAGWLWHFLVAGGPVMVPIGLVALLALGFAAEATIRLGRLGAGREAMAAEVLRHARAGDFAAAERCAATEDRPVPRALLACLRARARDAGAMESAVEEAALHDLPRLERFLPALSLFAGVAPLLGLLGTVTGMIGTFDMITHFGSGEPRLVAGGISEALITTVAGLVVAIPTLLAHSFLQGRTDLILADIERHSATLLNLVVASRAAEAPIGEPAEAGVGEGS